MSAAHELYCRHPRPNVNLETGPWRPADHETPKKRPNLLVDSVVRGLRQSREVAPSEFNNRERTAVVISRTLLIRLIFAALGLPVVLVVVGATGALLASMGDAIGAKVLGYIALAIGVSWLSVLVMLIVAQAIRSAENDEPPDSRLG